jgi:hypothetical protein
MSPSQIEQRARKIVWSSLSDRKKAAILKLAEEQLSKEKPKKPKRKICDNCKKTFAIGLGCPWNCYDRE